MLGGEGGSAAVWGIGGMSEATKRFHALGKVSSSYGDTCFQKIASSLEAQLQPADADKGEFRHTLGQKLKGSSQSSGEEVEEEPSHGDEPPKEK